MSITKSAGSSGVMCEKVDVSEEEEEVREEEEEEEGVDRGWVDG